MTRLSKADSWLQWAFSIMSSLFIMITQQSCWLGAILCGGVKSERLEEAPVATLLKRNGEFLSSDKNALSLKLMTVFGVSACCEEHSFSELRGFADSSSTCAAHVSSCGRLAFFRSFAATSRFAFAAFTAVLRFAGLIISFLAFSSSEIQHER